MPRKRKPIDKLCKMAQYARCREKLSDEQLIRAGCLGEEDFRRKMANFNAAKKRIQAEMPKKRCRDYD